MQGNSIEKVSSAIAEFDILQKKLLEHGESVINLEILEAGCGRHWPFNLNKLKYKITGLDLDSVALKARIEVQKDLDAAICGDLITASLPVEHYDVIYCSHVLEHIKGAELVLNNFVRWLKPGGIILLRIPDRDTAFGFVTRTTPIGFHIFYKRYLRGIKDAGKPGFGPYPTYYDHVVSYRGIVEYCKKYDLNIRRVVCQNADMDRLIWWARNAAKLALWIIGLLSLGKLSSRHNNLAFVISKGTP